MEIASVSGLPCTRTTVIVGIPAQPRLGATAGADMTFFEMQNPHAEAHRGEPAGWLRAAVLGANDGLVCTASLMVGVAARGAAVGAVLVAGAAGLAAGSMAMAAGEYVS